MSSPQKNLHCSHGRYGDRLIWCLSLRRSEQTLKLYRDQYRRARPPQWERVGTKLPAATTFTRWLLRSQSYAKYADIFEKQTTILSWTWRIYCIQYVKVDIRTNKLLNGHFRFRLSCRLCYRYRQQTRITFTHANVYANFKDFCQGPLSSLILKLHFS